MSLKIRKDIKSKVTMTMMVVSLLISVLTGAVCITTSSNIILSQIKEILLINSKNESAKLYRDFERLETSVNNIAGFEIQTCDMKNLKNKAYMLNHEKPLRLLTLSLARVTDWNMSSYFYFVPEQTGGVYGAWYSYKPALKDFVSSDLGVLSDFKPDNKNFTWYYKALKEKKATWTDLYRDIDLKKEMISYSRPVYKDGRFFGVAGMDISLDNLQKIISNIKLYKTTDSFLIDKKFNIIASKNFATGENIDKAYNGIYKELMRRNESKDSGVIEYKENGIDKFATYSTLPNGYTLFITVPISEAVKDLSELNIYLISILIFVWIMVDIIAILLGNYIIRQHQNRN